MTVTTRLSAALQIQAGEGPLVRLVLAYGFLLGIGRMFCAVAVSGMFLELFGAAALPYTFLGAALVVPITGLIYLRLQSRVPLARLIAGTLALLIVALLAFRVALGLGRPPALVMTLMIGYTTIYVLITLIFWGLTGQLFNLRQGKRLFGLLSSGSEFGDIAGGMLTLLIAPLIGAPNLLILSAAGMAGALLVERLIVRRFPLGADQAKADEGAEPTPGIGAVLRGRFVRGILLMIALSQLAYFFVETIFYDLSLAHFSGAEQLSGLVGATVAASSILTILLQVTLAGSIVRRFGVRGILPLLPAFLALGAAMVAVGGTLLGGVFGIFVLMLITRIVERALRFSVDENVVQLTYQPIPAAQRSLVQTVIDGGVRPLAAGLAGALILLCTRLLGLSGIQLAYMLALIALAWLVVTLRVGGGYSGALLQALSKRRLSGATLNLSDAASLAIVRRGLQSPHPGEALYALQLLEASDNPELGAALALLLEHPEPAVRREALLRLARLRPAGLAAPVRALLTREQDAVVRGQALRTLAALGAGEPDMLAVALADPAPEVQLGAVAALAHSGAHQPVQAWLRARAASTLAGERALVARALGELAEPGAATLLRPLLADADVAVRRAALAAVPTANVAELWPEVVSALARPALRSAAMEALARGGAQAVPALGAAFEQPGQSVAQRLLIVQACGRAGPAAAELLLPALNAPAEELRHGVALALEHCGYRATGEAVGLVRRQLGAEAAYAAWALAAQRDLGASDASAQLRTALASAVGRARERVLALLGVLLGDERFQRARAGLAHPSSEQRSYAVEAIDLLLPPELRPLVLPLVEQLAPAEALAQLERHSPQPRSQPQAIIEAILAGERQDHPWVRACARYALAQAQPQGVQAAQPGAEGADELVLVERVLLLKGGLIFAAVPEEDLLAVAALLQPEQIAAGAAIFARGDAASCAYIIATGRVRVHDGERTLNELAPRELFGEVALLDARPRTLSATALASTTLLRLDREDLAELIADHVSVARGVIRGLIRNLRVNVRELGALERELQA